MPSRLREIIPNVPEAPGVYLLKDRRGEIFYIGKAKSLRDRLRSYASGSDTRAFVALLDALLADVEVVLTHSDKEAILLENELIKAHQPRFNVKLTDDKRFLCLRLDVKQDYPRLEVVRRPTQDGAKYFGPYHSASAIRESLRLINRHFQLRTCSDQMLRNRTRPCLQHQIKRCPAPCVFDLTGGAYQASVADVVAFLEGRQAVLVDQLKARMARLAAEMHYEAAGLVRDQLQAVHRSLERQRMVSHDGTDRDIIGLYREGPAVTLHVLRSRMGRLMDAQRYAFVDNEVPTPELLGDFVSRYYGRPGVDMPDEVLLPEALDWEEPLGEVLSEQSGHRVRLVVPQRGDKRALVQLANKNAQQAFVDQRRQAGAARTAVERLQRALRLQRLPSRLECADISHLQGQHIVASVVCFVEGVPHKPGYRHYKVRSTVGQDDFQSMYEIVSRRVRRGRQENDLPQLLVIDGGKGQLGAAAAALRDQNCSSVELISLAKARRLDAAGAAEPAAAGSQLPVARDKSDDRSPERVFVFGQKEPIVLRQNSAELFLLTRARDEAHRFAITFHRQLRRRAMAETTLDRIDGVGPKRRRQLLRAFGSVSGVRQASAAEMAALVGDRLAQRVYDALHPSPSPPTAD